MSQLICRFADDKGFTKAEFASLTEFLNESPEFYEDERGAYADGHTRIVFKLKEKDPILDKVCLVRTGCDEKLRPLAHSIGQGVQGRPACSSRLVQKIKLENVLPRPSRGSKG